MLAMLLMLCVDCGGVKGVHGENIGQTKRVEISIGDGVSVVGRAVNKLLGLHNRLSLHHLKSNNKYTIHHL